MKVKTCEDCRKRIEKDIKKEVDLQKFDYFQDSAKTMTACVLSAMIASLERRNLSDKYIKKMYEDVKNILELTPVFGKELKSLDLIEEQEKKYGIKFNEIKLNLETKEEFMYRKKIR